MNRGLGIEVSRFSGSGTILTAMTDKNLSTTSLIDRAGLDRGRVKSIISRGLEGADDGELFLEYRQSEALGFDNGRLKHAT